MKIIEERRWKLAKDFGIIGLEPIVIKSNFSEKSKGVTHNFKYLFIVEFVEDLSNTSQNIRKQRILYSFF